MVAAFRAKGAQTSPQYKAAAVAVTLLIQLYCRLTNRPAKLESAYTGKKAE